jgi:radical SAM-linked protein
MSEPLSDPAEREQAAPEQAAPEQAAPEQAAPEQAAPEQAATLESHRVRVRYEKSGDLRLLSHRDMLRLLERLFRRAGLDLAMSQGFHPKPKMSFPSALGLGIDGMNEVMELELATEYELDELHRILNEHSPVGLSFLSVESPPGNGKAQVYKTEYTIPIPVERSDNIEAAITRFLDSSEWPVEREKKKKKRGSRSSRGPTKKTVDLRVGVEKLWLEEDQLHMTILEIREASVRPRDVLEAVEAGDIESDGEVLVRSNVILSDELPDLPEASSPVSANQAD